MRASGGNEDIAMFILNIHTGWKWVVIFTYWLLFTWHKSLGYPRNRRLGGPQSQPGCLGGEISLLSLHWIKPQSLAVHPVVCWFYWLSYCSSVNLLWKYKEEI